MSAITKKNWVAKPPRTPYRPQAAHRSRETARAGPAPPSRHGRDEEPDGVREAVPESEGVERVPLEPLGGDLPCPP